MCLAASALSFCSLCLCVARACASAGWATEGKEFCSAGPIPGGPRLLVGDSWSSRGPWDACFAWTGAGPRFVCSCAQQASRLRCPKLLASFARPAGCACTSRVPCCDSERGRRINVDAGGRGEGELWKTHEKEPDNSVLTHTVITNYNYNNKKKKSTNTTKISPSDDNQRFDSKRKSQN